MWDVGQVVCIGGSCEDEVHPMVNSRAERSPYGAFVHRVHWGTLRTVENTGKLIKLGNTANNSAGGGNTGTSNSDVEIIKHLCLRMRVSYFVQLHAVIQV